MSQQEPQEGYIHHPEKGPLHYIDWGGEGHPATDQRLPCDQGGFQE